MSKIKEGSRVVYYRAPLSSFSRPMQEIAKNLKGQMDTVMSIRGDSCQMASGWAVSKRYLKLIV